MSETVVPVPRLTVETVALDTIGPLVKLLDPRDPLLFIRRGQGIAGIGEAVRLEFTGPNRMTDAAVAWRSLVADADITDAVGLPGTGLVALGSFAFSEHSAATSVLIVPSVIVGKRDGVSWITRVNTTESPVATSLGSEYRISLVPGAMTADAFVAAVDAS